MSHWVDDSEISAQLGYKILIAGLSEAGKTAVKRIFFLKQQTMDVTQLSATINYERMSVILGDKPITIVDLGGQKIFLKRFLSSFSPFVFSNVKVFIFLIDVANRTTRNNAIQYFISCLEKLKVFSPEAEIFVFLHKNDLVVNSPNYESIHEQLKEQFQIEWEAKRILFFRTTIYRPETIIDAFGRIIELTMPSMVKSEFVQGREIGEIEEYHRIEMILREPVVGEAKPLEVTPEPKIAGDIATLEKLQSLMKKATIQPGEVKPDSVLLGKAANEESSSETVLTHIDRADEPILEEISSKDFTETTFSTIEDPQSSTLKTPIKSEIDVESDRINTQISHLIEFYRIKVDEATEIANSGYSSVFEMAATSGIPISLSLDIFLKYLPFVKKEQGEEKFKLLGFDKILELFSVYMKNELKEKDIVKCLLLATEKPEMSIRNIVKKYLIPKEEKLKKKEVKEEVIIKKPTAKLEIPIEAESIDGIISLPNTEGLAFKIDLIHEDALNARLTLYIQSPLGNKEIIGNSIISSQISPEEILYLLAYELNMIGLGFFEDGISSMNFAAKIIHESLRQLVGKNLISTGDVITKKVRKEKGYLADTVDFVIPIEVEVDGNYLRIPDSENVAFEVTKGTKGFIISFIQRGFPIGLVNVIESITVSQLRRLLKEAMQLPVESEGAIDFAGRIIHSMISNLVETGAPSMPSIPTTDVSPTEEQDKTESELQHYLSLLEKD
ncbi:MAG: ADP-ribosylation factor-like protein [Candidatus Hermodarchaeota archaeon]